MGEKWASHPKKKALSYVVDVVYTHKSILCFDVRIPSCSCKKLNYPSTLNW